MAGGTGAGAAACAFHFDVVGLGDVEEVVAVGDGEGVAVRVFVDEGYCASGREISMGVVWWVVGVEDALLAGLGGVEVPVAGGGRGGEVP